MGDQDFRALRRQLRSVTDIEVKESFCTFCDAQTDHERFFGDDQVLREGFGYGNHPVHYAVDKCCTCKHVRQTKL
jgi:hypothetical protein